MEMDRNFKRSHFWDRKWAQIDRKWPEMEKKRKEKNPKWVNLRYISNFEVTVTLNTMKFEAFYEIIFYSYTPHAQGH